LQTEERRKQHEKENNKMDTFKAFVMGTINCNKETMVFDWLKAANIIKQKKPKQASAGLSGDWEWTGGKIWENGKPIAKKDTYTYLESTWAVPELMIDGKTIECYEMKHKLPMYDCHTYWPKEALDIIED
jgi:hypothetical protein